MTFARSAGSRFSKVAALEVQLQSVAAAVVVVGFLCSRASERKEPATKTQLVML